MEIPGYRIERLLGQGGMASVYLALQESLERRVALKVLRSVGPDTSVAWERFVNEGRIVAALNHPNIVTVHDIGVVGDALFLSMEYVPGGDLKQRIAGGMVPAQALSVVHAVARALRYAHAAGVVHRDIKPANILFREDGVALVSDFGIAKSLTSRADLTATGSVMGSPSYLSPEQACGREWDGRTDQYSLGIVLYQMLVGETPYRADSDIATIFKQIHEPLPRLPPDLEHLQPLLDRMTAKQPEERFADMAELLVQLEGVMAEVTGAFSATPGAAPTAERALAIEGGNSPRARPGRPRLGTLTLSLAALSLTALVGIGVAFMLTGSKRDPDASGAPPTVASGTAAGAAAGSPSPPPSGLAASTDASVGAPVLALLARADAALAAGRRVAPPGDNARDLYRKALVLAPGNERAEAGLDRLAAQAAERAERDLAGDDASGAAAAVTEGLEIRPGNDRLRALHRRIEDRRRTQAYLASAESALADNRLTTPPADNAYYYYQQALAVEPGNARAAAGLDRIAERYAALAQKKVSQYHYGEARELIDRGLEIRPGDERLLALREQAKLTHAPEQALNDLKKLFH